MVDTPIGATLTRERRVSVTRVFAGGCAVAALIVLGGAALEVLRLGTSDAAATARVEQDVRAAFADMTADVVGLARGLAGQATVANAMAFGTGTDGADQILFAAAKAARDSLPEDLDLAVTIYDGNATPRAWAGRASDVPDERAKGPGALFVSESPLGLRLVRVEPIAAASNRAPLGSVAVEHVLTPPPLSAQLTSSEYVMQTSRAPVSLRLHDPRAPAPDASVATTFTVAGSDGAPLLDASVAVSVLVAERVRLRRTVVASAIGVLAFTVLLLAGPLLDNRSAARSPRPEWRLTLTILLVILAGGALFTLAFLIAPWSSGPGNRSAFRLLLGGVVAAALSATIVSAAVRLRVALRSRRRPPDAHRLAFVTTQLACGILLAALLVLFERVLGRSIDPAAVDLRHFSLHPWTAPRLATLSGILFGHAAVLWTGALVCVLALARWRLPRRVSSRHLEAAALWLLPIAAVAAVGARRNWPVPVSAVVLGAVACVAAALVAPRLVTWYRRATVAARILALFMAFLLPALLVYPSVDFFAGRAMRDLIEKR